MAEALPNYALTTVARIKNRLQITTTSHDDVLLRLIASISDFIEGQCNRRFKSTEHTEYHSFDQDGAKRIFLEHRPVTALTSVKYRQGLYNNPNYTAIPATDYILEGNGKSGIIKVDGGWLFKGTNVVEVVYTAGYKISFPDLGDTSKHDLPGDITDLCERLVVKIFKRREDEGKESISMSIAGGGTTRFLKELTEEDRMILGKYTIVPAFV